MIRQARKMLGRDLFLADGIRKFLEADDAVRATLPIGAVVIPYTQAVAGAFVIDSANGSRLIVQYEIEFDAHRADLSLQYEEP